MPRPVFARGGEKIFPFAAKNSLGTRQSSYSTGGPAYGCNKQILSSSYALRLSLFTTINPWHRATIFSQSRSRLLDVEYVANYC